MIRTATAQPDVSWTREAFDLFTVCCTKPLLAKLAPLAPPTSAAEPTSTVLGDWYATPVKIERAQMLICANEASLLPLVVPNEDLAEFPTRFARTLETLLTSLGAPSSAIGREMHEILRWRAAPTANASLLATLNGYRRSVEHWFATKPRPWSVHDLNRNLAERPSKLLDWQTPGERAVELLRAAS